MTPDLTPIDAQQCAEWRTKAIEVPSDSDPTKTYLVTANFTEQRGHDNNYECTCPAYKFKGMTNSGEMCKHIKKVAGQFCDWNSEYSDERQTEKQERNMICPRCGGRTEGVTIMV